MLKTRISSLNFMQSVMAVMIALFIGMMASAIAPVNAYADTSTTVTLGADLTDEQKETVLKFFNLTDDDLKTMNVITVTNQDERQYLSSTVPSSEIGTQTLSCSYIQPTSSGGINVQTANLTYVTKEVLYNALQTAGIENCNLVVTAPYKVSGTGALTGVFMAYKQSGKELDSSKEEAATKEMVDTANLQSKYGEAAPEVVSDVKDQVASNPTLTDDQIRTLIKTAAAAKGINLSDSDVDTILAIAKQIQNGNYDKNAFSAKLSDAEAALNNTKEYADGILGEVQKFFDTLGEFFSKLFGIAQDKGGNIINNLNTNVYSLDNGQSTNQDSNTPTTGNAASSTETSSEKNTATSHSSSVNTTDSKSAAAANESTAKNTTENTNSSKTENKAAENANTTANSNVNAQSAK